VTRPTEQPASAHHLAVGDIIVTTLLDAYAPFAADAITGVPEQDVVRLHAQSRRPSPMRMTVNAFLVRAGERFTLIDTGLGPDAEPTPGRLPDLLAALGVAADDIATVLLTHLHSDHGGGLLDAGGAPAFPNAHLVVHEDELAFWLREQPPGLPESVLVHLPYAVRCRPYGDRIRPVRGGRVLPGITLIPHPGHTPGHSGYLIESRASSCWFGATSSTSRTSSSRAPRPERSGTSTTRRRRRRAGACSTTPRARVSRSQGATAQQHQPNARNP
jgi:glyoxylase-like metal-dependent hydrolase (beta-lactamase superfamily II)